VPTPEQEQQRLLTRTRQQLVEDRSAIKNKIRMKCHQMGLIDPDDPREMSHKLGSEMLNLAPSPEFTLVIEAYWQVWNSIEMQIKKIDQKLHEQAKIDPNETIYRSAPGIGPLSARILSNELGDLSQFANERQLFSYTGLTPSEHSSGEKLYPRTGKKRAIVAVARQLIGRIRAAFKTGQPYQINPLSLQPA
jgi:transposase